MPKKNQTYTYQPEDNPVSLSQRFGITPDALLSANPGGTPFSTGQTINLPYQTNQFSQQARQAITNFFTPSRDPYPLYGTTPERQIPTRDTPYPLYADSVYQAQNAPPRQPRPPYPLYAQNVALAQSLNQNQSNQSSQPANVERQVWANEIDNALNSPTAPGILSPFAAQSLGIDPSKNGYVMQGGQWVYNQAYAQTQAAGGATPSTTPPPGGQQQEFNPRNISVTWNKYAKNPKNRFKTNLKWAQNAWRRQAGRGKNKKAEGAPVQDESVTGFGLVNFGASAG